MFWPWFILVSFSLFTVILSIVIGIMTSKTRITMKEGDER